MAQLTSRLVDAARRLVGITSFDEVRPPMMGTTNDAARKEMGGMLAPPTYTRTRWYQADLETASHMADQGDLTLVGQLGKAAHRDGTINGIALTRTSGLIALPKRWRGKAEIVAELTADSATRPLFDEMVPPQELAAFAWDMIWGGVAFGELLPVPGRDYKLFMRHDPEFLLWRRNENRWYYRSITGLVPITPGDGRHVLFTAGKVNPWQFGAWSALGRAYITKEHAMFSRSNYSRTLANPARLGYAPQSATDAQRNGFISMLLAWSMNSVIELPPGWDAKLLESNGRGYETFKQEIESANEEIMLQLAGQVVTTTGGSGFANAKVFDLIRADLIKLTADSLAHTINTQILPAFVLGRHGEEALRDMPRFEWDVTPPQDQKTQADVLKSAGAGIKEINSAVVGYGLEVDVQEIAARFGVPLRKLKRDIALDTPATKSAPGEEPPRRDHPNENPEGEKMFEKADK